MLISLKLDVAVTLMADKHRVTISPCDYVANKAHDPIKMIIWKMQNEKQVL